MKAALACALAALAASAAYWGTLDNGFAWDDHVHIEAAPFVQDARNARVLLTPGFWKGSTPVEGSARPLLLASLLADRALWGPNPGGYHLDSLLLHAACAAALAWLAFLLLGSAEAAALAGALFALHPVQSEAVCGITFRADPLAALGVILALAFLRMAFTRRSAAWSAAAAAAFGLGLLAKENAAVFPALALLMELLFPSGPAAARARRTAALLAAAALAAYAAFRIPRRGYGPSAAAHGAAPPAPTRTATQFHESPPEWKEAMRDPATRVRTMSGVLGDYARLTLWPAGLQADRSAPVVTRWSAARAWTGWLVLLVVLAGAWAARAALPAAAFGLAWFLVALTPVSGVVALPNLIAERYLYLAVAGAALAAAAALEAASRRLPKPRLALLALSACLLAPAFAATRARVPAWRDDDALFGAPAPTESSRLDYNKGYLAQQSGRLDEAEKHYRRALELNHRSIEPMVNLAYVERVLARPEEGLALLRRAVSVDPRSSTAYEALGDALEAAGKREEALEAYHRAVGTDSRRPSARRSFAAALARAGRIPEALRQSRAAAELQPRSASARFDLGLLAQDAGRLDEAAQAYRAAVELDPKNGLAWANLGVCLHQSGHPSEALASIKLAVSILPASAEARRNLGAVLDDLGRLPQAQAAYETAVKLDPSSAAGWHAYGVVLQKEGERARANQAYLRALKLDPERVESLVNLAELRADDGDFVSALGLAGRARELRPADPTVRAAYDDIARRSAAAETEK